MPLLPKLPDLSLLPRWVLVTLLVLACFAPIPFAIAARMRSIPSALPRIHIIPNMDNQGRFKSQQTNPIFTDGRAMRVSPDHTIAREDPRRLSSYDHGLTADGYVTEFPMEVTETLVRRGQDRFEIYCTPCHGYAGYGNGMIAQRAIELEQSSWVPPASFHEEPASSREVGFFFNTITHGVRNMPAYGSQIPVADRWAIVSYVRALQASQSATMADVPADRRAALQASQESAK